MVVNYIPLKQILKLDKYVYRIVYMRRPIDVGGSIFPSLSVPTPVFLSVCLSFLCPSVYPPVHSSLPQSGKNAVFGKWLNRMMFDAASYLLGLSSFCTSVHPLVRPSVRPSVYQLVHHASKKKDGMISAKIRVKEYKTDLRPRWISGLSKVQ